MTVMTTKKELETQDHKTNVIYDNRLLKRKKSLWGEWINKCIELEKGLVND